jgi:ABC-type sugar transport system substrate-binding protein
MSRALNIDATLDAVVAMSAKHSAAISAIEPLLPRGTRVVFMNADGAAAVARAYGTRVLNGAVTREPWKQRSPD